MCSVCGELKEQSDFYPRKQSCDGLKGRCKPCDIARTRRWQAENSDSVKAKRKAAYDAEPDKHRAKTTAYRLANPESVKAATVRWRITNVQHVREYARLKNANKTPEARRQDVQRAKRYRLANPEKVRAQARNQKHKRRAREVAA